MRIIWISVLILSLLGTGVATHCSQVWRIHPRIGPQLTLVLELVPPWQLKEMHHWGDKKGGGTDLKHWVSLIPGPDEAAGGKLYIRGDTHTTLRSRWARAEASFLLGGEFTAPQDGRYHLVFHYTFTGETKFEWRATDYRFRAIAVVTGVCTPIKTTGVIRHPARPRLKPFEEIEDQWTTVKTICAFSSRGGTKAEQDALIKAAQSALQAVANAVVWDPVSFGTSVAETLYHLVKVLEGKSKRIPLQGAETLELVCDLNGGQTYHFFLATAASIYARAEDLAKAESRVALEVQLQKVEIFLEEQPRIRIGKP